MQGNNLLIGPNMRKLAAHAATKRTITQAGGLGAGLARLHGGEHLIEDMTYGLSFARAAVKALRAAKDVPGDPNPYVSMTDEEIAGEVLRAIEARKASTPENKPAAPAPRPLFVYEVE